MAQQYYKRVFAKPQIYNGIEFRSTLERDFAMFLDGKIVRYKGANYYHEPIKWQYEPYSFPLIKQEEWIDRTERDTSVKKIVRNKKHTLNQVVYTPDFYLPEHKLIVEIKGVQFDDKLFHLRLRLFKHCYPKCAIWIVRHHDQFADIDKVLENIKIGEQ